MSFSSIYFLLKYYCNIYFGIPARFNRQGQSQTLDVPSLHGTLALPAIYQVTENQRSIIAGNAKSERATDNVTKISIRRPEMRCIEWLRHYLSFFLGLTA